VDVAITGASFGGVMGVGAGIGSGALLKRKIPTGGKMGGAYVWVPSLTATHSKVPSLNP